MVGEVEGEDACLGVDNSPCSCLSRSDFATRWPVVYGGSSHLVEYWSGRLFQRMVMLCFVCDFPSHRLFDHSTCFLGGSLNISGTQLASDIALKLSELASSQEADRDGDPNTFYLGVDSNGEFSLAASALGFGKRHAGSVANAALFAVLGVRRNESAGAITAFRSLRLPPLHFCLSARRG